MRLSLFPQWPATLAPHSAGSVLRICCEKIQRCPSRSSATYWRSPYTVAIMLGEAEGSSQPGDGFGYILVCDMGQNRARWYGAVLDTRNIIWIASHLNNLSDSSAAGSKLRHDTAIRASIPPGQVSRETWPGFV